jgi:hypothetical protein
VVASSLPCRRMNSRLAEQQYISSHHTVLGQGY